MTLARLFPGLLSFETGDADLFFGRNREIEALVAHIERDPVVVVNGLSGCGKSSLLKAGVIPCLLESEKLVIYTSVFENVVDDVMHELRRTLRASEAPEDYVDALEQLYERGPAAETYELGRAHSGKHNLVAIRSLVRNAFTARDLDRFCQDRPSFRSVLSHFGPRFSLEDRIDVLITYCQTQVLLGELLSEIRGVNPRQYESYESQVLERTEPGEQLDEPRTRLPTMTPKRWQPGQPIVLIVDQFEQALRPTHPPEALEAFLKGISRSLTGAHRFVTFVIVLRADWLYFLETTVRRFNPRLNVYSFIFTLDPLTEEAARDAIVNPLQLQGVRYDDAVVEEIIDSLQRSSVGPSVGPYIHPIQLQMVLRSLFDLAEDSGRPELALTEANFRQSGGVESILRNYLTNTLGSRSEAWRLLARFVGPDGKTGHTIRRSGLLSVPAAGDVELELGYVINQGFVEAFEAEEADEAYYRLAHDYLVEAIVDYLNKNPDQQGWKLAEEWLASGMMEWQESTQRSDGDGLLLERNRYLHIYQYRDRLRLTNEAQGLLTLTALRDGHEGLGYWLSRGPDWEDDMQVVAEKLLATDLEAQYAARSALAGTIQQTDGTEGGLGETQKRFLGGLLRRKLDAPANPAQRDAAARGLWTLQQFDTSSERLKTGALVFRRWAKDHSRQIASYPLTALLVLVLVLGVLVVQRRLQGSWLPVQSLKAGVVPLVGMDPADSDRLYAVTAGGPGPREGIYLYAQEGEGWEALGRDLGKGWPQSMIVVDDGTGTRYYAALYGEGILRSEDGGRTWSRANRGLPSHALTSLAVDPDNPSSLFVGTDDGLGVLSSSNGGDSWGYYDHEGEMLGAEVAVLAYTGASGGALIAGTVDGRILIHRRDSSEWELRFGLSRGAINALAVAEGDNNYVYAGTHRGIVLHSRDGGESWEVLGRPAEKYAITAITVAPDDPGRLYISVFGDGGYTVWKSQDMGQSWERVQGVGLTRNWIGALMIADQEPEQLIAGTSDGLFISGDGGATWRREPLPAPLASVTKVAVSAGHAAPIYAAAGGSVYVNDGSLYLDPADRSHQWVPGQGLEAHAVRTLVVDPANPQVAYAGVVLLGEWSVSVTRDGGHTWQRTTPPPIAPVVPDTMSLAVGTSPDGKTVVYAGTVGCGVFRSEDAGQTWDTLGRDRCDQVTLSGMPSDVSHLAVDALDADHVYAATGQQVYYSADGGGSWLESDVPEIASPIAGLVADAVEPGMAYLITASDGFWRSEDGGKEWKRQDERGFEGAEFTAIAAVPDEPGHLIVGASNGEVWETSDGGVGWRSIRRDLAISSITSIAASEALKGRILVGSSHDGMALFEPGRLLGNRNGSKE